MAKGKQTGTSHPILRLGASLIFLSVLGATCYLLLETPDSSPRKEDAPKREILDSVEMQIALAREGFSPGSIDGIEGSQSRQALAAFQRARAIEPSGVFDEATRVKLQIADPTHEQMLVTQEMLLSIDTKPQSWVERGYRDRMAYNSMIELVAEQTQSHPDYLARLNPETNWQRLQAGDSIFVPKVPSFRIEGIIDHVQIRLSERTLQAVDHKGQILFHCPVSIARNVEKRPVGELSVKVRVSAPNYTFNPAILSATAAREGISKKFIIQPGPNNPVGSVWIGLDRPSYGIHGTPEPEKVGRTESSGCFRLANWNAETLLAAIEVGTRVVVYP